MNLQTVESRVMKKLSGKRWLRKCIVVSRNREGNTLLAS